MHATREWVEKIEAAGLPWPLFFSLPNQIVNKVLAERTQVDKFSKRNLPNSKVKENKLWLSGVVVSLSGTVTLLHRVTYDEVERRARHNHIFTERLPPPISWHTFEIWKDGVDRKTMDDALTAYEGTFPVGVSLMCLELGKYGYLKHELTVAFELETDAVLFSANLTNTL